VSNRLDRTIQPRFTGLGFQPGGQDCGCWSNDSTVHSRSRVLSAVFGRALRGVQVPTDLLSGTSALGVGRVRCASHCRSPRNQTSHRSASSLTGRVASASKPGLSKTEEDHKVENSRVLSQFTTRKWYWRLAILLLTATRLGASNRSSQPNDHKPRSPGTSSGPATSGTRCPIGSSTSKQASVSASLCLRGRHRALASRQQSCSVIHSRRPRVS
jgi:hypothetical protein